MTCPQRRLLSQLHWLLAALFALSLPAAATAADFKARLQLAWGTDGGRPPGKDATGRDFQQVDAKTREKLRHLKWANYWVMNAQESPVTPKSTRLKLSEKCAIDLKDAGNGNIEVRLYNLKPGAEPKFVKAIQHSIKALKDGEYCILAGDDRDNWDTAWFVIITAAR